MRADGDDRQAFPLTELVSQKAASKGIAKFWKFQEDYLNT